MLQIVTKMYFREGVPLHSTLHREVLYTNRSFLRGDVVALPIGEIAPSTGITPVSAVTLSVIEHLEAEDPDGTPSVLVATSGIELVDSLADLLSFGLNAVFSRDSDLVRRLVPDSLDGSGRTSASKLFRETFDGFRFVQDAELEDFRHFMTQLLALKRSNFEAAMRAIRRMVRGMQGAVDDPTVAYVDLVAALESLSDGTPGAVATWDRLDARKRGLIDTALAGADSDVAVRVRQAVMEAERLGAKSRFLTFVIDHVSPQYFRAEAADAIRPIRGPDFERAVKLAYDIRSRNVHVLDDLPPEAWVIGNRAETVSPPGMGTMLSLEGLARLARHVVRSYVGRAPVEHEMSFNWRASIPGQVHMRVAPQYWIWNADAFDHKSADQYFSAFVAHLADVLAERNESVTDMRVVLESIERLLPGTADGPAKGFMVAIYSLWHRLLSPSDHRPRAAKLLADHEHVLRRPGLPAFVVGLVSDDLPEWTDDEWHAVAVDRRRQRSTGGSVELPAGVDAALQVIAAEQVLEAGRTDDALELVRFAIDELPGNESLIRWEAMVAAGEKPEIDLRLVAFGVESAVEHVEAPEAVSVEAATLEPEEAEPLPDDA